MLNENLMDSKDIIIAKLKLAIKEFQEYDIERKKYYSNALVFEFKAIYHLVFFYFESSYTLIF